MQVLELMHNVAMAEWMFDSRPHEWVFDFRRPPCWYPEPTGLDQWAYWTGTHWIDSNDVASSPRARAVSLANRYPTVTTITVTVMAFGFAIVVMAAFTLGLWMTSFLHT